LLVGLGTTVSQILYGGFPAGYQRSSAAGFSESLLILALPILFYYLTLLVNMMRVGTTFWICNSVRISPPLCPYTTTRLAP